MWRQRIDYRRIHKSSSYVLFTRQPLSVHRQWHWDGGSAAWQLLLCSEQTSERAELSGPRWVLCNNKRKGQPSRSRSLPKIIKVRNNLYPNIIIVNITHLQAECYLWEAKGTEVRCRQTHCSKWMLHYPSLNHRSSGEECSKGRRDLRNTVDLLDLVDID